MSPQQIAHYRITAKIGQGGMGEVYRATDTRLGRDVAIKILPGAFAEDPDRMARFAREAQVLASLNHPNIAAIYGLEERALVMELVEGPTLEDRIAGAPVPMAEALAIARQIGEALEYAHEKGIVHRDLKPANIKLTSEGQVKVLDFGLAKALSIDPAAGDPASSPTLTMRSTVAGMIMGTAAYMSPEQARGAAVDRRADVWSYGVVLYEMLTGRRMFAGESVSDTLAAVLKTDPDWSALPQDTPVSVRRLLRRCMERDRKRRLPDITMARLEIDESAAADTHTVETPRQTQRGYGWWAAGVLLLTLAGLGAVHFRETPAAPVPVRFQIPAPDKATFGNTGLALSPDGRMLAFIASEGSGQPMVWVRSLDSLAARPLPGTEGARFLPFWSPDNRFIGFGSLGKLKTVPVSGGPVDTLSEIPGAILGGSWSRQGVILFGSNAGGLYRVPQTGGVAAHQTTTDPAQGEIGHMRPWFLPDGRHFLYVTRMERGSAAIYLATLDGGERKRLAASNQFGAYAPPTGASGFGHLLFLRDGTLMAQLLDAGKFDLSGEPFPVAEGVGSQLGLGYYSVSGAGLLAYRSGGAGLGSRLNWIDRQGRPLGTVGEASSGGTIVLSPDGKRVAMERRGTTGTDIWLLDIARGIPSRFTFSDATNISPSWSPDGARLYFASDRQTAGWFDIYQKDSSGSGNEELLIKVGGVVRLGNWSPDGRYLVYEAGADIWMYDSREHKAIPFVQSRFGESHGQFSPDGHWIAYASGDTGPRQVYVQSFPVGAGKFLISAGGAVAPRWRGDGKEIFFLNGEGNLMAVDVKTAPRFEAGTPKPFFDTRFRGSMSLSTFVYDVAADGSRFLVNTLPAAEGIAESPITVVLNWQAAVKR